jgi:hypothetical protein
MKLKEFQKKCPGVRLQLGELEVDATRLIEHDFFERATQDNYRVEWHSTENSIFDVMRTKASSMKHPKTKYLLLILAMCSTVAFIGGMLVTRCL